MCLQRHENLEREMTQLNGKRFASMETTAHPEDGTPHVRCELRRVASRARAERLRYSFAERSELDYVRLHVVGAVRRGGGCRRR